MATPRPREGTPPPVIAKAGRYTVFLTPPANPVTLSPGTPPALRPQSPESPLPSATLPPTEAPPPKLASLVQVPPQQLDGLKKRPASAGGVFGFFWDALAKVQDAHSTLDVFLADWFGLDQSKYQWALNDYYETKGPDKEGANQKEAADKVQNVMQ